MSTNPIRYTYINGTTKHTSASQIVEELNANNRLNPNLRYTVTPPSGTTKTHTITKSNSRTSGHTASELIIMLTPESKRKDLHIVNDGAVTGSLTEDNLRKAFEEFARHMNVKAKANWEEDFYNCLKPKEDVVKFDAATLVKHINAVRNMSHKSLSAVPLSVRDEELKEFARGRGAVNDLAKKYYFAQTRSGDFALHEFGKRTARLTGGPVRVRLGDDRDATECFEVQILTPNKAGTGYLEKFDKFYVKERDSRVLYLSYEDKEERQKEFDAEQLRKKNISDVLRTNGIVVSSGSRGGGQSEETLAENKKKRMDHRNMLIRELSSTEEGKAMLRVMGGADKAKISALEIAHNHLNRAE